MPIERLTRLDAGDAVDYLLGYRRDVAPIEGWTGNNRPSSPAVFLHGQQAQALKVAAAVNAAGWYPNDGDGTIAAQANAGQKDVTLNATALQSSGAGLTAAGMVIAGRYGTDTWEINYVASYNTGTKVVTCQENLKHTWPNASQVRLFVPLDLAEYYTVMAEFSTALATAAVRPFLIPWIADGGRLGRDPETSDMTIEGTDMQDPAYDSRLGGSYYGRMRGRPARGFMGLKLYLLSVSAGTVSLWCGRT